MLVLSHWVSVVHEEDLNGILNNAVKLTDAVEGNTHDDLKLGSGQVDT